MVNYKIKYRNAFGMLRITFRVYEDGCTDVKLDDNFAFALGYRNAKALRKGYSAFVNAIELDWARVSKGNIFLYGSDGFILLPCCIILGSEW